jgi:hypothetical protein
LDEDEGDRVDEEVKGSENFEDCGEQEKLQLHY